MLRSVSVSPLHHLAGERENGSLRFAFLTVDVSSLADPLEALVKGWLGRYGCFIRLSVVEPLLLTWVVGVAGRIEGFNGGEVRPENVLGYLHKEPFSMVGTISVIVRFNEDCKYTYGIWLS